MTSLVVRRLGRQAYEATWTSMKVFTDTRDKEAPDELWLLEHPPVYTLGQAGREEHILDAGAIEVVRTDRGGQVTYHGPGQLVGYVLIDIKRRGLGIRHLVCGIEDSLTAVLESLGIEAASDATAHGVYVGQRKIAALGLRVRKGCTYHGFALNVDMDLGPFAHIDPCGYKGQQVTDLAAEGVSTTATAIEDLVIEELSRTFGYGETDDQRAGFNQRERTPTL